MLCLAKVLTLWFVLLLLVSVDWYCDARMLLVSMLFSGSMLLEFLKLKGPLPMIPPQFPPLIFYMDILKTETGTDEAEACEEEEDLEMQWTDDEEEEAGARNVPTACGRNIEDCVCIPKEECANCFGESASGVCGWCL